MPRIKQAAQEMLNNVILPFWMSLKDETHGGYYSLVDFDLQVDRQAEKGCILNSRILWFFSEADMLTGRADAAACARHAYQWFEDHCFDRENGGVYWSCDALGRPLDTTKHTYNQAFAIYALSAYYRLTEQQAALDRALELFRLIESRCTDAEGYLEAFTVDWKPESNEKLSENGVMADKTMNTLLHVFEGYAGLYQASRAPAVGQAMRRILGIYAGKVYSPALHRQLVFFDSHYRSIIDLYSYGHDIESSWLIDWGCALLGDAALTARIGAIDSDLARSVYQHAYRDHSLLNECERGVDDTTRVWWVQAEAVLGFVNEYEKSGGEAYAAAAADIWHYITDKLVDKRPGGEWFWSVDESGQPPAHRGTVEMPLPQRAYVYGTDQEGPPCRSVSCTPNTCARRPCRRPCWPARTISPTGTTASTTGGTTPSSPASTSPWSGGSTLPPPPTPTLWSGWG